MREGPANRPDPLDVPRAALPTPPVWPWYEQDSTIMPDAPDKRTYHTHSRRLLTIA